MTLRTLACTFLLVAACGGSSSDTQTDAAGSGSGSNSDAAVLADAAPDICAQISATRCTNLMTCSPADLQKRFGDLATCEARDVLACDEALAAPDTGQNVAALQACNAALAAESCTDFFEKAPPPACTTQVGPGSGSAACGFPGQCASAFCTVGPDALCGECATQPKVGDSCATVGCGQDLVCVAKTQLCQAPLAPGGSCSAELPCADGLTCVGAVVMNGTTTTNGTCTAELTTSGATCDPKHKTLPDCNNDDGLTCDTTTSMCVALPLVAAGQPCGVIDGVRTECTAAGTCVITPPALAGTCVAPAADGAACDSAAGPFCLAPAKCVPTTAGSTPGTCELPGSTTCP